MKAKLILSSLVICSAPVCADVTDDVRCAEIGFSQSVENKDIAAFGSFIDPDARFVGASVRRGVADITQAWSVFFSADAPAMKWRPQVIEVLDDGKLALSRGPYRMITKGPDGELSEQWGTFNSVWRKQDDLTWKVVFDAGNESADVPPAEVKDLLDQETTC